MPTLTKEGNISLFEKKLLERNNEIESWPSWKKTAISYSVNTTVCLEYIERDEVIAKKDLLNYL